MSKAKSRMFDIVTETWNPVTGCLHNCVYCWARKLVEIKLRFCTEKYRDGFRPKFHPKELKRKFRPDTLVFVSDMGDLFGKWVPKEWIVKVLEHIAKFPRTKFLLLTKNPYRFKEFMDIMPSNVILGATIETDRDDVAVRYSQAPIPTIRLLAMRYLRHEYTGFEYMISIEPILYFSEEFANRIIEIEPDFIYVGYDNYNNGLLEPPLQKTLELIEQLESVGITVFRKTLRERCEV